MHILQSFCIAMFLPFFRHNKTPKVFCLTFGVHVKLVRPSFYFVAFAAIFPFLNTQNSSFSNAGRYGAEMLRSPIP